MDSTTKTVMANIGRYTYKYTSENWDGIPQAQPKNFYKELKFPVYFKDHSTNTPPELITYNLLALATITEQEGGTFNYESKQNLHRLLFEFIRDRKLNMKYHIEVSLHLGDYHFNNKIIPRFYLNSDIGKSINITETPVVYDLWEAGYEVFKFLEDNALYLRDYEQVH